MERVLKDIEPKEVFRYFEDLTRIPRCSGNEKEVTDYLIDFAKEHGLECYRDEFLNVVIKKRATKGYEDRPGVIFQGHTDIVCEKNADTVHDFLKDPINIYIDGDKITANGTTLGADDGIGVALGLAIFASKDLEHPALEMLCTSDEERGMNGVEGFDFSRLEGKTLINLDSDDEGVFVVGCAGGPMVTVEIPLVREAVKAGYVPLGIKVRGLKGGHSGEDIHRGRANSIKLMSRILTAVESETDMQLVDLSGGVKYNAIPRESDAVIYVSKDAVKKTESIVSDMEKAFQNEFMVTDKGIKVGFGALSSDDLKSGANGLPLTEDSKDALLNYLVFAETGIIRMNMEFKDTVESSVSIGFMCLEADKASIETLTRSSVKSMYMDMFHKIERLTKTVGGELTVGSNCPEWEYNPESRVKKIFQETYREMYNKEPELWILHAGLECGVISQNTNGTVDMISAGPNVRDLHTPGEFVTISSVQKVWEFLCEVLKRI